MTTFKGYMRSTNAAINRWERAHQRSVRDAAKIEKLRQKQQMLANAAHAVEKYNELIALLTSIHKETIEACDWQELLNEPAPTAPVPEHKLEEVASKKLTNYSPSFFDKLFKLTNSKKHKLEQALIAAQKKDIRLYEDAQRAYTQQQEQWEKLQKTARGVLAKEPVAYRDAMELFNPFAEVTALGTQLNFDFHSGQIIVTLLVNTEEVIPKQALSLTSTGKLSQKDMAISKFHELYQDHVCSCLLRVARETLALLPVEYVLVNVVSDLLDPSTGRITPQVLVSATIFPETLDRLTFETLDPSDSMRNFKHNMSFTKTGGFKPVKPVEEIAASASAGPVPELAIGPTSFLQNAPDPLDQQLLDVYREKGALHAVKYYKDQTRADLRTSKDYVDRLAAANGLK